MARRLSSVFDWTTGKIRRSQIYVCVTMCRYCSETAPRGREVAAIAGVVPFRKVHCPVQLWTELAGTIILLFCLNTLLIAIKAENLPMALATIPVISRGDDSTRKGCRVGY